ncbi:transporter [Schlesneria paludicola]|uniref:transporter n=1 Tax=Schlesneria paludicola TaxID=360056 RepID=UPI00029A8322|nr:transporter [Schlesneria paludicola]
MYVFKLCLALTERPLVAFGRRSLLWLLALSLLCGHSVRANFESNVPHSRNPDTKPAWQTARNAPAQAIRDQNRRGGSLGRSSRGSNDEDSDSSDDNWTLGQTLLGHFFQPVFVAMAVLLVFVEAIPAADDFVTPQRATLVSAPPTQPDTVFPPDHQPDLTNFLVSNHPANPPAYPRPTDWGNGHITIADPAEFPRIRAFDCHAPGSLWENMRPNLLGQEVTDEWDFYNLINTDRPDFTDATYSAGKGVTIIETGYTFSRSNDSGLHTSHRTLPESLIRVGLTDEFELRMKWFGYVMTDVTDQATGLKDNSFGGSDLYVGFKYEAFQQDDWRPMVTILGGSTLPTGTGGVSAGVMQPFGNLVLGWGFRRWLYLKASTGVDFLRNTDVTQVITGISPAVPVGVHGSDSNETWHQSLSLLFQVSKRVGGFAEWYTIFSTNSSDNRGQNYIDTGVFYYLTTNVQLDARVGQRLSRETDSMFTGAGLSVRF